jgi:adenine-specific DNA-methyltransferase
MARESVDRESFSLSGERLRGLEALIPEAFREGKIDVDALRAALGDAALPARSERYSFGWAGKRDATLIAGAPTRATLIPMPEESVNWDSTNNLFIEGDNLEALKVIARSYFGRVKMIYIDPPYNTGGDFVYPDNYADPLAAYLEMTGQVDENGLRLATNAETNGRYHSAWLSMMYPRLLLARQLLRDDGVIFVSIDDNEVHNLRLVMNEVFGEECFKNCIIFRRGAKSVQAQFETIDSLGVGHEYIFLYSRSSVFRLKHLRIQTEDASQLGTWNNHWRGTDRRTMRFPLFGIKPETGQWRWGEKRSFAAAANYERMLNDIEIDSNAITQEQIDEWYLREQSTTGEEIDLLRLSAHGKPEHYVPPSDTKVGSDMWTDVTTRGSAELESIMGGKVFDNPKPTDLIKRMLTFTVEANTNDIILDFFAGSGTTAQAVLEANMEDGGSRRFILIQMPQPTSADSVARKMGYETVSQIGKERVRRVIQQLTEQENGKLLTSNADLGFRVYKLAESTYRQWQPPPNPTPEAYTAYLAQFVPSVLVENWNAHDVIVEVALKEGFGLNMRIEMVEAITDHVVYRVSDADREQAFYICLDDRGILAEDLLDRLGLTRDDLFMCMDNALDDTRAANFVLQARLKTL